MIIQYHKGNGLLELPVFSVHVCTVKLVIIQYHEGDNGLPELPGFSVHAHVWSNWCYLKAISYCEHLLLRHKLLRMNTEKIAFCDINYCELKLWHCFCDIIFCDFVPHHSCN